MPANPRPHPSSRSVACGLVLTLLLGAAAAGAADRDVGGRWGLGVEGGFYKLLGGDLDFSTVDQFGSLNLSRGLSRQWTLQLAVRYGYVRPGVGSSTGGDTGWSGTSGAPLYTPMVQPLLRVQRRFAAGSRLQPFVGCGAGLTSWKVVDKTGQSVGWFPGGDAALGYDKDGRQVPLEGTDLTLGLELGLDLALGDHWALTLGGRAHFFPGNDKDNVGLSSLWGLGHEDINTSSAEGFLGVTWWFGSSDRDGDGVPNARDACPEQAEDRDGYRDDDGCPDPDNDGDGVADDRDGCPDEAEDRDGFQDEDGCPDPDNDGDGVVDADDRCPDTPAGAAVDKEGCVVTAAPAPAAPLAVLTLPVAGQTIVLQDVAFPSGSARLSPVSAAQLDELAAALLANPEVVVEVRGHTDAVGAAEVNLDLSQRRAMAVRDALVQRGVAPVRVTAVGYGEDFPVAGNDTPEGRARNRRVELHRVQ